MTCHYYIRVPEETEFNSVGSNEETATNGLLTEGQAGKETNKEGGCTQRVARAGSHGIPTPQRGEETMASLCMEHGQLYRVAIANGNVPTGKK